MAKKPKRVHLTYLTQVEEGLDEINQWINRFADKGCTLVSLTYNRPSCIDGAHFKEFYLAVMQTKRWS